MNCCNLVGLGERMGTDEGWAIAVLGSSGGAGQAGAAGTGGAHNVDRADGVADEERARRHDDP
jgi:hypothetical protein